MVLVKVMLHQLAPPKQQSGREVPVLHVLHSPLPLALLPALTSITRPQPVHARPVGPPMVPIVWPVLLQSALSVRSALTPS
jgi:hypothetical protein